MSTQHFTPEDWLLDEDEDFLDSDDLALPPEEEPDAPVTPPPPPESAGDDQPTTRVLGWTFKKSAGKAPEVQVVEGPIEEPTPEPEAESVPDESPLPVEDAEDDTDEAPAPSDEASDEGPDLLPIGEGAVTPDDTETEEEPSTPEDEEEERPATWGEVFRRLGFRRKKPAAAKGQPASPQLHIVEDTEETWDEEEQEEKKSIFAREPQPDIPAKTLAILYGNKLKRRRIYLILALPIVAVLVYLNLSDSLNLPLPTALWDDSLLSAAMAELLGIELLLLGYAFVRGIGDLLQARPGMHTVTSVALMATLADCAVFILLDRSGPLPCMGAAGLLLWGTAAGLYLEQKGLRLASRSAAALDQPNRLTLLRIEGQTTDMLQKYKGDAGQFGSQLQESNGIVRRTGILSAVILLLGVMLSILSALGQGDPELLLWCASVILLMASPLGATLAYGLPWSRVSERLNHSGGALAGWDGIVEIKEAKQLAITDDDLIPTGMITCNGIQFYGKSSPALTVGYAATLATEAGGGLAVIFDKLLYSQGARHWNGVLTGFTLFEGGCSGNIGKDHLLLGTAEFMKEQEIPLPEGISVRTAVFCAINGTLAAQFAMVYHMPTYVQPAVQALDHAGYTLALAARDFNLNPRVLGRSFNLPMTKLRYPYLETRVELSTPPTGAENSPLGGLLTRDGLDSHSELVLQARKLFRIIRKNTRWVGAASIVGLLLGTYLTVCRAYTALQPSNILLFLLLWSVPCLLNSMRPK